MIQSIWAKKVPIVIEMNSEDVADSYHPLPLVMLISWNHYIGFYYEEIMNFFMAYAPFPYSAEQFHLVRISNKNGSIQKQQIDPISIVSHLIYKYESQFAQPLRFQCSFRKDKASIREIDLKRAYKNNLKTSTALRYGKKGASVLTVEMSTNNVDDMFDAFKRSQYNDYLGSEDYNSDNLGYSFLIHSSDKIPIRIIGQDFMIERSAKKQEVLKEFIFSIIGESIEEIQLKMHGIPIKNMQIKLKDLQKYGHPDGFLYMFI